MAKKPAKLTKAQLALIEVKVRQHRDRVEFGNSRYIAGLERAAHEAMNLAKEAYARGKDDQANGYRNLARELGQIVQMTADAKDEQLVRDELALRAGLEIERQLTNGRGIRVKG